MRVQYPHQYPGLRFARVLSSGMYVTKETDRYIYVLSFRLGVERVFQEAKKNECERYRGCTELGSYIQIRRYGYKLVIKEDPHLRPIQKNPVAAARKQEEAEEKMRNSNLVDYQNKHEDSLIDLLLLYCYVYDWNFCQRLYAKKKNIDFFSNEHYLKYYGWEHFRDYALCLMPYVYNSYYLYLFIWNSDNFDWFLDPESPSLPIEEEAGWKNILRQVIYSSLEWNIAGWGFGMCYYNGDPLLCPKIFYYITHKIYESKYYNLDDVMNDDHKSMENRNLLKEMVQYIKGDFTAGRECFPFLSETDEEDKVFLSELDKLEIKKKSPCFLA